METPKEYYYVYYSYEKWGRGYIGSRGCDCLPEEDIKYFGSYTDKTFHPTQKIILEIYETREQVLEAEVILHDFYDVANNPHFANRSKQTSTKFYYKLSSEEAKKIGQDVKTNNWGICGLSREERSKNGKLGAEKNKELGLGVFGLTPEQRVENGKKGGNSCKEKGLGIFTLTREDLQKNAKRQKELGIGLYALTHEQRVETGRKKGHIGGNTTKELGKGIFSLTREQRSENSKKMLSQKWQCTETGHISNPPGLSKYQNARGIDTSKRIRIS